MTAHGQRSQMKICVLNYTGDRRNWGCQATSRNLLAFLHARLAAPADPDIVTVPLPRTHPLDGLVAAVHGPRIRAIYSSAHPSVDDLRFLHALTHERFGDLVREVEAADVIVFQGEGTVGPQAYLRNVQLFGLPLLAAHLWRKRVVAINQTLYACDAADAETVASIFGAFALVAVREARSYAFARGIGLDGTLLCPDMAFAASAAFPGAAAPRPTVPYFCISGSAALGAYHIDATLEAVRQIAVRHQLRPVFVFSRPDDGRVMLAAEKSLRDTAFDVVSAADYGRFEQILPLLSAAAFVLGGRYHTAISALAEGTPVILLPGNTFKTEGIGPMLGLEFPVIAADDVKGIVSEADRLLEEGETLRNRIREAIEHIRACQALCGDLIRQIVTTGTAARVPECLTPAPRGFPAPGPHDHVYLAKNRAPQPPLAILSGWRLRWLRQTSDFQRSLRASIAR